MENLRRTLSRMSIKIFHAARQLKKKPNGDDDNVIACGFTLTSIATMLYYAAEGPALEQLEHVLRFTEVLDGSADEDAILLAFRESFYRMTREHKPSIVEEDGTDDLRFKLHVKNRLFVQKNAQLNEHFLETIKRNLKVEVQHLDFTSTRVGETEVEKFLKEKLRSLYDGKMPPAVIDETFHGPRVVIANATYFSAGWEVPFDRTLSFQAPFHQDNGEVCQATYMTLTDRLPFYESTELGVKVLELPYYHNGASLILTMGVKKSLPQSLTDCIGHTTLNDLYTKLTRREIINMHMQKRMKMVRVTIPKFHITSIYRTRSLFEAIGIREIMKDEWSSSKITDDEHFRISEGVHKCSFEIDESGTFVDGERKDEGMKRVGSFDQSSRRESLLVPLTSRSRRSSYCAAGKSSFPDGFCAISEPTIGLPEPEEFYADQPFAVAVRYNRSSLVIFSGCVMCPSIVV